MVVKASGGLTLTDIQSEFGGTPPVLLSEYYANGQYAYGHNTIPRTGQILTLTSFYNTSKPLPYPPISLTANSTIITTTSYGQGTYTASASADRIFLSAFRAYDNDYTKYPAFSGFLTNSGTPNGTYTTTSDNGTVIHVGSWSQIQMPANINVKSLEFTTAQDAPATPTSYAVLGSTNGTSWTTLFTGANGLTMTQGSKKLLYFPVTTQSYSYFRFVIKSKQATTTNNASAIGDLVYFA